MATDVVVVELDGEFDLGTIDRVDSQLSVLDGTEDIVIDLRRTTFVDSVTLARFVGAARRQAAGGGRLVLAEARASAVRRVLSITQLDRVLPVRRHGRGGHRAAPQTPVPPEASAAHGPA